MRDCRARWRRPGRVGAARELLPRPLPGSQPSLPPSLPPPSSLLLQQRETDTDIPTIAVIIIVAFSSTFIPDHIFIFLQFKSNYSCKDKRPALDLFFLVLILSMNNMNDISRPININMLA